MTGDSGTSDEGDGPAWHERTSTVVGVSVGALAAIGLLWLVISWMVGGSDGPGPESQYYLEPSVSGSRTASTTTTTSTETITSTSPPVTTDINPGDTTTTSSTDTTSSSSPGETTPPRTRRPTTNGDGSSTRQRPRLNETRTLYPRP